MWDVNFSERMFFTTKILPFDLDYVGCEPSVTLTFLIFLTSFDLNYVGCERKGIAATCGEGESLI